MKTLICSAIFLFLIGCGGASNTEQQIELQKQSLMTQFLEKFKKLKTRCPELPEPLPSQADVERIQTRCLKDDLYLLDQILECILKMTTCNEEEWNTCSNPLGKRISQECKKAFPQPPKQDSTQPETAPNARFNERRRVHVHGDHPGHDHQTDTTSDVNMTQPQPEDA